jgi:hypothetical protein
MRWSALLSVTLVAGCSEAKFAPVSGTVTLDGDPLANVAVSFQPIGDEVNPGPGSSARTNDEGHYTLRVIGGGEGALIGKHRVEINSIPGGDANDERRPLSKVKVPRKYNLNSQLKFDVKRGANQADWILKSQ